MYVKNQLCHHLEFEILLMKTCPIASGCSNLMMSSVKKIQTEKKELG